MWGASMSQDYLASVGYTSRYQLDAAIGCFIEETIRLMVADAKEKGAVRLDDYSMWIDREGNDV